MTGEDEADKAHLDALMYRMLAGLLLLGAGVLVGLVVVMLALPRIETPEGPLVLLPGMGTRHGIAVTALPVLGAATLVLGGPGLLALAMSRRQAGFGRMGLAKERTRVFRRPAFVLLAGGALLAFVLLRR